MPRPLRNAANPAADDWFLSWYQKTKLVLCCGKRRFLGEKRGGGSKYQTVQSIFISINKGEQHVGINKKSWGIRRDR